jgi:superfamily II DNA helicase RecQ
MHERLHTASGKSGNEELRAKDWQLDVAEAVLLGLDVTLIAGTGLGKTLPFILPLLVPGHETAMSIIVTPLIALQANHVRVP